MFTGRLHGDIFPPRVLDVAHWVVGSWHSVETAACRVRVKTHNVFRSILLSSICRSEKGKEKTPLMREIEDLRKACQVPFVENSEEGREIFSMISSLYARALVDARKVSSSFALSALSWLEKKSTSIQDDLEALNEKITGLWEKTLNDHSRLDSKIQSAKAQVIVDGRQPDESVS